MAPAPEQRPGGSGGGNGASVWVLPLGWCVLSALWLAAAFFGIELGIALNGVDERRIGGAGPDVFDIARTEIALTMLGVTAVALAALSGLTWWVLRRTEPREVETAAERVGTTLLWLVAASACFAAGLLVFAFGVLAPLVGGPR